MLTSDWFPEGIVVKGTRSGTVEEIQEPYSLESAARLARTYAALWSEPIEWWGRGDDDRPHNFALPKQLHSRPKRTGNPVSR
jgi:hypothetical protein